MSTSMDRFNEIVKMEVPVSEKDFWNAAIDVFNDDIAIPDIVPPIEKI